jgi:hypothetical protein
MSNLTHFFSFWNCVDTDLLGAGSLGHLTESVPHFLLSYANWNNNHDVFSRYGKNNWRLGRIFVYHVDSAFQ